MTRGKLYGVGVGPGDPGLITLKAADLIRGAQVIFYPSLAGAESFARAIASSFIQEDITEITIAVPMTVAREPAQAAYDEGAQQIALQLDKGNDVVCLCEGDPIFYGSFMYIYARLATEYETEIVPGVTSVTACAARARTPLAARNERLTVLPGPLPEAELQTRINGAESVVIMKVGRHLAKVRTVMERLGVAQDAIYVERATLGNERVMPLTQAPQTAPYFSMILLTKGADPWL